MTGGVQGIGKLLVAKFAAMHPNGEVNIIVVDIADHLEASLKEDVFNKVGKEFKKLTFYKCNLADAEFTAKLWERIVKEHGPVHILVNNAARVLGRRVDELSLDQVKLTMDINFHSYVQLIMLFTKQEAIKKADSHDF